MKYLELNNLEDLYLVWKNSDKLLSVKIENCLEVQANVEIITVPGASEYILGIINLRGEIVTILDIDKLVNNEVILKDQDRHTVVIFKLNSLLFGIITESIVDVVQFPKDLISNSNNYNSNDKMNVIDKIIYIELGVIYLIDLEKFYFKTIPNSI